MSAVVEHIKTQLSWLYRKKRIELRRISFTKELFFLQSMKFKSIMHLILIWS